MELLLFICALVILSLLAAVFGHDSRDDVVASKEHALALLGLTWDGAPRPTLPTVASRSPRRRRRAADITDFRAA